MSLVAASQAGSDQLYSVVASPSGTPLTDVRTVPSPAPSVPSVDSSYSLRQFLSRPLNILAFSLGVTGVVALLGLLVLFLIIQRKFARMQRRNRENEDQSKKAADIVEPAIEPVDGWLVRHPDGSVSYGIHRLPVQPSVRLLEFQYTGTEAGQGPLAGRARPEGAASV